MNKCIQCDKPRMVSPTTGKLFPRCEEHQREFWRECKRGGSGYVKRSAVKEMERECRSCGETKPLSEFPKNGDYYKHDCKVCYSDIVAEGRRGTPDAPPRMIQKVVALPTVTVGMQRVLFVDRANNQMVLCEVLSEMPLHERTLDMIMSFYRQQGYRVLDTVVELMAEAGD